MEINPTGGITSSGGLDEFFIVSNRTGPVLGVINMNGTNDEQRHVPRPWSLFRKIYKVGCVAAAFAVGLSACQSLDSKKLEGLSAKEIGQAQYGVGPEAARLEQDWGVKVLWIRTSAAGHMLDFRYRVLDPEKAKPLMDRRNKAYVVPQNSKVKLGVPHSPKVGSLRTMPKTIKKDTNYYAMFANPGTVSRGDKVTVVIGDFKAENLTVQ